MRQSPITWWRCYRAKISLSFGTFHFISPRRLLIILVMPAHRLSMISKWYAPPFRTPDYRRALRCVKFIGECYFLAIRYRLLRLSNIDWFSRALDDDIYRLICWRSILFSRLSDDKDAFHRGLMQHCGKWTIPHVDISLRPHGVECWMMNMVASGSELPQRSRCWCLRLPEAIATRRDRAKFGTIT